MLISAIVLISAVSSWPAAANRDKMYAIAHACNLAVKAKHLKIDVAREEYYKCKGDPKSYGVEF
jgi:hypothetical protein